VLLRNVGTHLPDCTAGTKTVTLSGFGDLVATSSGLQHHVVRKEPDVSEKLIASAFRIEE
jgi:hypothetical protein